MTINVNLIFYFYLDSYKQTFFKENPYNFVNFLVDLENQQCKRYIESMQWVTYSDEFMDIFKDTHPVTSLGQIKRLYLTLDKSIVDISEIDTKRFLFQILSTRSIPHLNKDLQAK